eukprot:5698000-Pyramimonas_sp.AAC.1
MDIKDQALVDRRRAQFGSRAFASRRRQRKNIAATGEYPAPDWSIMRICPRCPCPIGPGRAGEGSTLQPALGRGGGRGGQRDSGGRREQ